MGTPDYNEVVERFAINILKDAAPDLALDSNGNIAVSKWGDLMLNNPQYSAMFRLVQNWRFNAPMIRTQFDMVSAVKLRQSELKKQMFPIKNQREYENIINEISSSELGTAACAGVIVLVFNNLLQSFKDDIGVSSNVYETTPPLIGERSVGAIFAAASNYFRHQDEWIKANDLTPQQTKSMKILIDSLALPPAIGGLKNHFRENNICANVLEKLGNGSFDQLNDMFFKFSKNLMP